MSLRKKLISIAAGIISIVATAVFAGGPEVPPPPPPPIPCDSGVYLEGNIGYASINWNHITSLTFPDTLRSHSNDQGGFTGGGDIGYQFNDYVATEMGVFDFQNVNDTDALANTLRIRQWFTYAAFRLSGPVPFISNLEAFLKAGIAYRESDFKEFIPFLHFNNVLDQIAWVPVFAAGAEYYFNQYWSVSAEWMYVGGNDNRGFSNGIVYHVPSMPAANLFLAGLQIHFPG